MLSTNSVSLSDDRWVIETGKSISMRGVQISKLADGKLVERWGSSDELGLFTQLGLTS